LPKDDLCLRGQAQYLIDANGQKIGYIFLSVNLTDVVKQQKKLEEAVRAANDANQYKSDFLARMSHEIRTPLNAIIGISNIIKKELSATDAAAKLADALVNLDKIDVSAAYLLSLLNDILDLSKIEAGKLELAEEKVRLAGLFDQIVTIMKPRMDEKNIRFETRCQLTETHAAFIADPLRLRQFLINLLGNAVKFTASGGVIKFAIAEQERAGGRARLLFSVRDNGIGIDEKNIAKLFQPFEQASRDTAKNMAAPASVCRSATVWRA
jgi:signal transduction histidine kinase